VALLCVEWLNARSPVLLDLYLRFFCIVDVVLMYFSCQLFVFVCLCAAVYGAIKNNNNNNNIPTCGGVGWRSGFRLRFRLESGVRLLSSTVICEKGWVTGHMPVCGNVLDSLNRPIQVVPVGDSIGIGFVTSQGPDLQNILRFMVRLS